MDVEGNTGLSSTPIKQGTVAEAQSSSCSVATWLSQAPAGLVGGAPSGMEEFLCCKPVSPSSLIRDGLVVQETRLGLRRCVFGSWLHHKLLV